MNSRKPPKETYVQIPNVLRDAISDGALATYAALLEYAWGPGETYFRGLAALAESRGKSVAAIRRHLDELKDVGAINVELRGKRLNAHIEIAEWDQIGSYMPSGDRSFMSAHPDEGDRSFLSAHIGGDRSFLDRVTAQKRALHREEDDLKKMTSMQEDDFKQEDDLQLDATRCMRGPAKTSWEAEPLAPRVGSGGGSVSAFRIEDGALCFLPEHVSDPRAKLISATFDRLSEGLGIQLALAQVKQLAEDFPDDLDGALARLHRIAEQELASNACP